VLNATPPPHYAQEREPVPIVKKAGWAAKPFWMCAEKSPPAFHPWTIQLIAQSG